MKWYLANLIEYAQIFDKKSKKLLNANYLPYYNNTILIKARNSEEAYKKALKYGKLGERKHLNPYDEIVRWKFAGVEELVEIYGELEDMEEIAYSEGYVRSVDNIKKKIPRKSELGVFSWENEMKKRKQK